MPRGVKGSGKAAAPKTVKKKTEAVKAPKKTAAKARKPYPSREERIAMADKQIARLTKLNDARKALVAKTEKTLAERQSALAKSTEALNRELAKKERLSATPEMQREAKLAKKAEKDKLSELAAVLEARGMNASDLLSMISEQK